MKCLIIAAGQGSRLRQRAESKPLAPILGVPLIERIIRCAAAAGADEFFVVSGYQGPKLRRHLDAFSVRTDIPIRHIVNQRWKEPNGLSVLAAKPHLHEDFLLLMADHLFDPDVLRGLIAAHQESAALTLAIDSRLDNPLVDVNDVTRVLHRNGKIQAIAKDMLHYNAYDTGLFYCRPSLFTALESSVVETSDASLSGGVRVLARNGRAEIHDIGSGFWLDVDDSRGFVRAEVALVEGMDSGANAEEQRVVRLA